MSVTRKHLVRKLPRGYFGDCQITLPAGPLAQATPNFGGPSIPASRSAGVCEEGLVVAVAAETSRGDGILTPQQLREYADSCRTQRLHAARVISWRAQV